jgi:hydrophobic/amphiphilic exporter-1 (mainly G- bacteria), HAE1 family
MSNTSEKNEMDIQPVGWNAKLVDWFIRNSRVAVICFLAIVIGGGVSLASLRSEGFPSPEIKIAVINTVYRGASPETVESQIIKPIEAAIRGISGVTEVQSFAANSFGNVTATVDASSDFKAVLAEVRNQVQNVSLPADADKPEITNPTFGGNISYYAITGDMEPAKLRSLGEGLRRDLERVEGVKDFTLFQSVDDKIRISLDAAALIKYSLTAQDVQTALQSNNVTIPAGTVTANGVESSVVTLGSLTSIEQLRELALRPGLRLADVATIAPEYSYEGLSRQIGYKDTTNKDGNLTLRRGLIYELTFASDASVLKVQPEVEKVFEEDAATIKAAGAELVVLSDVSEQIKDQIKEIQEGAIGFKIGDTVFGYAGYILGGLWLIVLSMLAFVSWRAALISSIAVPVSLLFTFLALQIQGVSLNTLTLFSMVLVLGLIVDPAIVVLESIQRELDLGKSPKNAVIAAMNSVGLGVFMAVLTSIIVFVPFGVVSGIFGQIIKYIPITIIPALFASYFIPLLFLTFLAQKFLKPAKKHIDDEEVANLWTISKWLVRTNLAIGKKRWAQTLIVIFAFITPLAVSGFLFATKRVTPVQFSAPDDATTVTVTVDFPRNLAKSEKQALIANLENQLTDQKAIARYFVQVQQDTSVSLIAELLPRADRDADSPKIAEQIEAKLVKNVQNADKGIYTKAVSSGVGTPQSEFPVSINIYGDSLEDLRKAAVASGDFLRAQEKVTRVSDGVTGAQNPQLSVVLDRAKLNQFGIPAIAVAGALNGILGEAPVTKIEQIVDGAARTTEVLVSTGNAPQTAAEIANTIVSASENGVLRVSDVATVNETQGFAGISRLNGARYVTVGAKVVDETIDASVVQKALTDFWTPEKLKEYNLRSDALDSRGTNDEFIKSFRDLFIALGLAILLLYVVLAIFYRSFTQPLITLFAVPLTFIGVFPALTLVGGQFGFLEILGIITLSGIVVNVAIFLLDLANQKVAAGMSARQAIAEASGIRFRAIWLTKLTTLTGLLPLIVISPFWRSLATVVVAGVLTSGILSLFVTPVLYVWRDDFKRFLARVGVGMRRRMGRGA